MNTTEQELQDKLTALSEQGLRALKKNEPLYKRLQEGDKSAIDEIFRLDQEEVQPIRMKILAVLQEIRKARTLGGD